MNVLIKKRDLEKFYDSLFERYEIIGPVKQENQVVFDEINSIKDFCFEDQTTFSLRKFFLPDGEILFKFDTRTGKITDEFTTHKRIIVMHPCDANALLNVDKVYLERNTDSNYQSLRKNTLIFVMQCKEPYENCVCSSFDTDNTTNYDLLFTDLGDKYIIKAGSAEGQELINDKIFIPIIRDGKVRVNCDKEVRNLEKLGKYKNDKLWEKEAAKCLNCNACISVCPTCMCFEQIDETSPDGKKGMRKRHWSFCHMRDFTKVAGGYVFRENKLIRFRHRIYHKLKYFKEKFGKNHLCVGCGRCVKVCPVKIDMFDIVEKLGKNGNKKE